MNKNLLALKPYLESVEEQCGRLSKEKLAEIILGLAKEVPAGQRIGFLETLDRLSRGQPSVTWDEGTLGQIEALKGDIRKRTASIENGSYHEDQYYESRHWDDDDEPPEALSEEHKGELEALFGDAAQLFLAGELEQARDVYASLFGLLDNPYGEDEEHDFYDSPCSLEADMREARARYCRCVYETTLPPKRVPAMLAAMNVRARLSASRFDVYENDHPMFGDVMDSKPGELAQQNEFLSDWRDALGKESVDRADMLLLEAAYLLEGLEAVRVRVWGGRQPRAWLFWIRLLVQADDWQAVAAAAEEALPVVDHSYFRALIAERLMEAGQKIKRAELVLAGRREIFFSLPNDSHLLRLIEEADRQKLRDAELEKALGFVSSRPEDRTALLVKLLLMAGKIDAAFEKARSTRALGWSYGESADAVLFAGVLSFLCLSRIEEAITVRRVLRRHADSDFQRHAFAGVSQEEAEDRAGPGISVSGEILRGLRSATVSPAETERYLLWAVKIGRKRIEEIVSNKHRGAYDRAAEVLGSLAECYLLNGDEEKCRAIIDEYRNQKFNRYPSFRKELDSIVASSGVPRRSWGNARR